MQAKSSKTQNSKHAKEGSPSVSATSLFHKYRSRAKRSGVHWNLSPAQFHKITKLPCYLCGVAPLQRHHRHQNGRKYEAYVYQGIDRLDSTEGYTVANSRPCCGTCNRMKSDTPLPTFKAHMEKIMRDKDNAVLELAIVTWQDCYSEDAWMDRSQANIDPEPYVVVTVGFVVKHNKEHVVLAQTNAQLEDQVATLTTIPCGMIQKFELIEFEE